MHSVVVAALAAGPQAVSGDAETAGLEGKSPQRLIPPQRQVAAFDRPARELRLVHVGSKVQPLGEHEAGAERKPAVHLRSSMLIASRIAL
jgi:hypothetical protein